MVTNGMLAIPDPAQWGMVVALAAITILYALMRPMMKRKKDPLGNGAPGIGLSRQRGVEREMESLLVELSEMARQVTAQLDTRSAKLEELMREADAKIAELKRLGDEPERLTTLTTSQRREEAPSSAEDPRYAAIYDLADQGQSPQAIAQQLNRPRGEVELILALRVPR